MCMADARTRKTRAVLSLQILHVVWQAILPFVAPASLYPFLAGGGFVFAAGALGYGYLDQRRRYRE
mgnify:CR=1 FL=1